MNVEEHIENTYLHSRVEALKSTFQLEKYQDDMIKKLDPRASKGEMWIHIPNSLIDSAGIIRGGCVLN